MIAGASAYGDVKVNVVCGPKSTKILANNAVVPGSPLTLDKSKPNYLFQSITQDVKSPTKSVDLSKVVLFKSTHSDCPIAKYDILNPSKGVRVSGGKLYFSAGDKTP